MVPYLRAANVKDGQLVLSDVKMMNFSPAEQAIFKLRAGDVLVTEGSGSLGAVGASAVWNEEIPGTICFQNTLVRLRPRPEITDARYLGWWARGAYLSGDFASIASGANIYHLSADRIKGLAAPLPPIGEQRRIADFLDVELARIDQLAALQGAVRESVIARITAALDARIGELVHRFGEHPFRRSIRSIEQGVSPQGFNYAADSGAWGVLKVSAVKDGSFFEDENKSLPGEFNPVRRYEIRHGDLLITRANTPRLVGAAAVANFPRRKLMLCDKIFRIATTPDLLSEFLVVVSTSTKIRTFCAEVSHGTSHSMANLKAGDVKSWPIPSVPISVQLDVIAEMSEMRSRATKLLNAIDRQAGRLAERRQALITAAVTGQIDVTTARGFSASGGLAG
ncbi:restriction endonuclease subunit S [Actinoalloteichus fjordicus]|nr:restriction endonuclease subunit S [Actinoalloteichus fjordicus]